jgi:hypothetical protein
MDAALLEQKDLTSSLTVMKKFNARRRLKVPLSRSSPHISEKKLQFYFYLPFVSHKQAAANAIILANRMKSMTAAIFVRQNEVQTALQNEKEMDNTPEPSTKPESSLENEKAEIADPVQELLSDPLLNHH